MNIKRMYHKVVFEGKKHSPELLLAAGILAGAGAIIAAVKATTKAEAVLDKHTERMEEVDTESKKEVVLAYAATGAEFAKLYAPAFALEVVSVTAVLASYKVLHARNVALASAYAIMDKAFKQYRSRVVEELGTTADEKFMYGKKEETVTKKITDENGKTKTVKEKVLTGGEPSMYDKFYDSVTAKNWTEYNMSNLTFIKAQQRYANAVLKAKGYIFLNEVYKLLGLPETQAGQVVGWIYDSEKDLGDNYIDFGLEDEFGGYTPVVSRYIDGDEDELLLHFNVDGPIFERAVEEKRISEK